MRTFYFVLYFFCCCFSFGCLLYLFLLVFCSFFFFDFWFLYLVVFYVFFFLRDRERNNMKLDKSGDEKDLRGLGDRKYDQNILCGKYNIFQMRTLLI